MGIPLGRVRRKQNGGVQVKHLLLALVAVALLAAFGPSASPSVTVRLPDAAYNYVPDAAQGGPGAVVVDPSNSVCYCANGLGLATVPNLDGGLALTAPQGLTLRSCTGVGCVAKPCVTLWVDNPDGDESWATACPRPWRRFADGGPNP